MEIKEILIKVDNKYIHLNQELAVPIQQTNIPYQYLSFRTHKQIYWKVILLEYNDENQYLRMQVTDYFPSDTKAFDGQKTTKEAKRIAFEKFDWLKLDRHLATYQKAKLLDMLYNYDTEIFFHEHRRIPDFNKEQIIKSENVDIYPIIQSKPIYKPIRITIWVKFSEAYFRLGYVTFKKHIKEVNQVVEFKIKNEHILPEFENVKYWFSKKLKIKTFNVLAILTITKGELTEVVATSSHIELITPELIDSVKYERTIALIKSPTLSSPDKALFTADEIFSTIESEDIEGNVFKQTEHDILDFLNEKGKIRNRKQLEYLSGSKQSENNKLRFTLHPNFGFLFLIEGKENNHFVWELLNSHATYIWTIGKSDNEIELQYRRIENAVNAIRDSGREIYKRAYRNNHIDGDLIFRVIEHTDIASDFVDGFVKWKHKLNEQLT